MLPAAAYGFAALMLMPLMPRVADAFDAARYAATPF